MSEGSYTHANERTLDKLSHRKEGEDQILKDLSALIPLSIMFGQMDNQAKAPLDTTKQNPEQYKGPDVLQVAPELPQDSEGLQVHQQKYANVNGPEYVRKVGNDKTTELDGDTVTNELFNEMGDFNMFNEEVPNHSKKTNIPY